MEIQIDNSFYELDVQKAREHCLLTEQRQIKAGDVYSKGSGGYSVLIISVNYSPRRDGKKFKVVGLKGLEFFSNSEYDKEMTEEEIKQLMAKKQKFFVKNINEEIFNLVDK